MGQKVPPIGTMPPQQAQMETQKYLEALEKRVTALERNA